ncbi:DUF2150 family protein [Methanohalophilus sp.]|uniref:DUF2150 family protein n=1 Tax=Methanohalophilus sp. TaxID=1966352 RepID=UPI0026145170|nr:DUF2150 family protein [Methanohalophilus sp.]MDK2893078.1 hypothetical protein [Methanohalophilus sp.]
MPTTQHKQITHEFYTEERWANWLKQVEESDFKLSENEEESKGGEIFVNMQDDVILACLKVIAKYQNGEYDAEETDDILASIQDIVLKSPENISEDAQIMIESLQNSFVAAFASFEKYLYGNFDINANIEDLINEAVKAEEAEDIEGALDLIAQIGALILSEKELPAEKVEEIPYGFVAEFMDGIDSIEAAMVGADSYKEDDGDYEI